MVVDKRQPQREHRDVGFFEVEDVRAELEKAKAQSQGREAGRKEMEQVLRGEIMAGVPIDPEIEGGPLERQYLMGFWSSVSERIKDLLRSNRDMPERQVSGWTNVVQSIEGRIRDVRGDTAKIDMGDVQDEINRLMGEAQEADTMRLAA